ncbi:urate hydroxylase PuuD [Roseibacillus persicicus]|uniref:Cysteine desulfurase n=1 Tax=Roseibacillus persicicus TaxID=454148 RepID=A0A918TTU0_9BACT|nr:urate hydroxylase PuuD [Roseibacillus persicicus]GHC58702.1 cysteine desulfurase [Roseibacillus persicicus]
MIEFFNITFRMIHVVAAIMWIGNSLLFTWFELNLRRNEEDGDESLGSMNMLHGGGIFFLQKRIIDPKEIPQRLHIFKWQSYTTWLSGFILLVSLFYTRGGSLLLDPVKTDLPGYMGGVISFASLVGGWLCYDLLWRSPVRNKELLGIIISFAGLIAYGFWLDTIFNGRAVFLQMGAMMGTMMSANVFFHIMINQDKMMTALKEGKPHDLKLGKQAKIRSTHNHYITFPVIFLMLSAHFPSTYGSPNKIAIAAVAIITLALIKHLMNCYHSLPRWKELLGVTFVVGAGLVALLINQGKASEAQSMTPEAAAGQKVFTSTGCNACHLPQDGTIAPSLHGIMGKERVFEDGSSLVADENYLRESILHSTAKVVKGYAPAMPPYATVLSDEQVDQLLAYLKSLN